MPLQQQRDEIALQEWAQRYTNAVGKATTGDPDAHKQLIVVANTAVIDQNAEQEMVIVEALDASSEGRELWRAMASGRRRRQTS